MSSVLAAGSDERFKTSRAIVFGPVADTIFPASCSSGAAQFWAVAGTEDSTARTNAINLTSREERGESMPGIWERDARIISCTIHAPALCLGTVSVRSRRFKRRKILLSL